MHLDAQGLIAAYSEFVFGIVCTFWAIHEVKTQLIPFLKRLRKK